MLRTDPTTRALVDTLVDKTISGQMVWKKQVPYAHCERYRVSSPSGRTLYEVTFYVNSAPTLSVITQIAGQRGEDRGLVPMKALTRMRFIRAVRAQIRQGDVAPQESAVMHLVGNPTPTTRPTPTSRDVSFPGI